MSLVFRDYQDRVVRLTDERLEHIRRRPEMIGQDERIAETLATPDMVVGSRQDPSVWLYHKLYRQTRVSQKYMVVVAKVLADDAFVITAFFTDRITQGAAIWAR